MLKTLRLIAALFALAAFVAQPALAQQDPPNEAQQTQPPDEATAEGETSDAGQAPAAQALSPAPSSTSASLPDGAGFESRVKASAAAAEGLQGPLDGGWTVRTEAGDALYSLQLVDQPAGALEGAWRDLRRTGAVGARGLVATMDRTGDELTLRFYPRDDGNVVVLHLQSFGDNVWSGSIVERGVEAPISLVRNEARPAGDYSGVRPRPVMPNGYAPVRHRAAPTRARESRGGRHSRDEREERGGRSHKGGKAHGSKAESKGGKGHAAKGSSHAKSSGGGSKSSGGSKKKKKR
ncbi:MAG: hypothetical protein JWP35_856 [Caulobacter sp.]|nr:hypothetical protein [Caulobacter sp.]